jgi:hypothetical protein
MFSISSDVFNLSTLRREAACVSGKLHDTYKTTRWHDPEEHSLKTISAPLYIIENILISDLLFKMLG